MKATFSPLRLRLVTLTGWVNRHQQDVIEYLVEENRVLKEQLKGRRLRLTDDQRRHLAAKGQGKNLAEAARKVRVDHFVYNSGGGAERGSGIDHWESKWVVEQHIRKLGLPATILRPTAFMENYYIEQVEIGILKGTLRDPIRADKPYQTIATEDIGRFAALGLRASTRVPRCGAGDRGQRGD
jgi:NmrA-like family